MVRCVVVFFLCLVTGADGHAVNQLFGRFTVHNEEEWRIHITLDIAFPEGEWDNDEVSQKPRDYLVKMKEGPRQVLREQAEAFVLQSLIFRPGLLRVEFPDFDTEPASFPEKLDGGAYLTTMIYGPLPETGDVWAELSPEVEFSAVIKTGEGLDEAYFTTWAGDGGIELLSEEAVSALRLKNGVTRMNEADGLPFPGWLMAAFLGGASLVCFILWGRRGEHGE